MFCRSERLNHTSVCPNVFANACNVMHYSTSSLPSAAREGNFEITVSGRYIHVSNCSLFSVLFLLSTPPSSLPNTAASVVLNHQQGRKPWQPLSVSAAQFRRRQGNSWQLGGPRGPGPGHMADAVARLCHTQTCFNDQLGSLGFD